MSALTLMLVGDTNVQKREKPVEAFERVLPVLRQADVLFGHCEALFAQPSTDPLELDITHKHRWQHSEPSQVSAFVDAGFDGVCCASNVAHGAKAVISSIQVMKEAGLPFCGIGMDRSDARKPVIVERDGTTFGFLSYTSVFWHVGHAATDTRPGTSTIKATTGYQPHPRVLEMPGAPAIVTTTPDPQELEEMREDIRALRKAVDIVVLSCHWGVSGSSVVTDYQRAIAHAAIDEGVDLVFGHHPHVLQGAEVYKGKAIFYSLANFAFDWWVMRHKSFEGLLVRCIVENKRITEVAFVPARRDEATNLVELHGPNSEIGRTIADEVAQLSEPYGTQYESLEDRVTLKL